jgi:hypothetical protein
MSINPFALFRKLIPSYPLQAAEVIAATGGAWLVEFPGGGQQVVLGPGSTTVGSQVYVRNGVIESAAPTLPVDIIEV